MPELKRLTSLRFFFAAWVFLSHCDFILGEKSNVYQSFFSYGYIGVGFFFVLSGFILSYVYKKAIIDNSLSYNEFIKLRIFRLYPIYLVTLLCSIPLVIPNFSSVGMLLRDFLLHGGMMQSFIPVEDIYFGFNGPSWSVSNEMFFYLLFPFMVINFRRAIFSYLGILLLTILVYLTIFSISNTPSNEAEHYFYYINPVIRMSDFLFGMILYRMYERNMRLPKYSTLLAVSLLVLFFVLKSFSPEPLLYSVFFYLPVGMLVLAAADEQQRSWLDKLLSQKSLVYLGRISYGLYLYHILILRGVAFFARHFQIELHPVIQITLSFLLLVGVSVFSYEFVEKPLNEKLRTMSTHRR